MSTEIIQDKDLWDKFVDESPYGTIFHKWEFLKILEKYSGYRLLTYGVYNGNQLICVFPLYFRAYRGLKLVFSPPPSINMPYLGFLMGPMYDSVKQKRKESYLEEMVREISAEIEKLSTNYVSAITVPGFQDIRPFKWHDYATDVRFDYIIDLERPLDDIWAGFDATCKKNIKSSGRLPMEIKESSDTETFYRIMGERLSQKGQSSVYLTQDPGFLRDLMAAYPDNVKMYFMYNAGEIVGVQVVCLYKEKFTLWLGSASGHFNEYLMWELLKKVKAEGYKEYEIPDANTQRLSPFKSKFNPSLEIDYSITKMDRLGKMAEWAFVNVVRGWV